MRNYVYVALIVFCVLIFPTSGVPVSPTVLFELGAAYHMDGRIEEAKACYMLVLNFEKEFGDDSIFLSSYKHLASHNLRMIQMNEIKDSPLFRRGK